MYAQRYAFPSVAGMTAFIIFPLVYTLWISFTNYSGAHVMTVDAAMNYHLQKTYKSEGGDYAYKVFTTDNGEHELLLTQGDKAFKLEQAVNLNDTTFPAFFFS